MPPRNRSETSGHFSLSTRTWYCNCAPSLPAPYFTVKKAGPNKGRGFYTCQEPRDGGDNCGFFLWEEKAKEREMKSLLGTEKGSELNRRLGGDAATGKIDKNTIEGHAAASERFQRTIANSEGGLIDAILAASNGKQRESSEVKVKTEPSEENFGRAANAADDEDDFGDWPLTMEDEAQLVSEAILSQRSQRQQAEDLLPGTPKKQKEVRFASTPITPEIGTKRKRDTVENDGDDGRSSYPTPQSGKKPRSSGELLRATGDIDGGDSEFSSSPFTLRSGAIDNMPAELRSPSASPSPVSHRHNATLSDGSLGLFVDDTDDDALASEILSLLSSSSSVVPSETISQIRHTLNTYALRAAGVAKGRDITRLALKNKDIKIAELQLRIENLERERETQRRILTDLKRDIRESVEKKSEAGKRAWAARGGKRARE